MSDVVPAAIGLLDSALRTRVDIVQQARDEDLARVREAYERVGVAAEVAPFFADLPSRIAASHIVIARGGASTVAELAVIGRPSILVPLPGSLDQDQAANARALAATGGARVVMQPDFTPERLASDLAAMLEDPEALARSGAAARAAGAADAAERLADLVLALRPA
jgi:UDP-N-acetylglucosamine--N-acetylmuramyl-(pentapeptide) pyrophosphoryl-undecaprenol N-acetylglucosamine transferase